MTVPGISWPWQGEWRNIDLTGVEQIGCHPDTWEEVDLCARAHLLENKPQLLLQAHIQKGSIFFRPEASLCYDS